MYSSQRTIEIKPAPPSGLSGRSRRQRRIDRLIAESGTTPGKLRAARMILVIGIMLAGSVAGLAAYARVDTTRDIAVHLAPLNAHVTTLYRSLADADATVAVAFLSGGVEPPDLRMQYDMDMTMASDSLRQVTAQIGAEQGTDDSLAKISRELPQYTGLVERVRANNLQGLLPTGKSFLGRASELMRSDILPQAADLQRQQAVRLDEAYRRAGSLPVVALTTVAASLGGLIWAQVFVFQRTHRIVNLGLLAASGAVVVGLLWWTAAGVASANALRSAHRHSQSVSDALVPAQIAALRARAIETNQLVSSLAKSAEEEFSKQTQLIARHLGDAQQFDPGERILAEGEIAVRNYTKAHADLQDQINAGTDGKDAVSTTATRFTELDQMVSNAIASESTMLGDDITRAQGWWLTGLPLGTGLLALAAAIGVTLGVRQRLEEYR